MTVMVDYGYGQSELCWGNANPGGPILEPTIRKICQGIHDVGGSRVRMGVQVGTLDDLDLAINIACEFGLKPLLVNEGNPTLGYTGGVASYAASCKMLAQRYGPSGTNQVAEYELFNESNDVVFNAPQLAPAGYAEYLKSGYAAIKSVHASSTVMPCGTIPGPTTWFGWEFNPLDWYTALYAAGAKDFMDAIAVHEYADVPPTPAMTQWKYMTDIRALMVAQGDSAKQVWVTEVGTSNPGPGITTAVVERDWLKAMVDGILSYPWMGPFFIYNFMSSSGDPNDAANNYGITTHLDCLPKQPKYDYAKSISAVAVTPSAPTGLAVTGTTASWIPAVDDIGHTIYRIYDNATGAMLTHTPLVAQTSAPIPGLTQGAHYVVYATAVSAAGVESAHSATASFTAPAVSGSQQQFTYDFTVAASVPAEFAQIGLGATVTGGVFLPNVPTVDKDYYTIAPYHLDCQSPDHYCEITQNAASASSDRYAMAGCRVSPDGTQGVFAFVSGNGQDDAAQIITIDGGVVTPRSAKNATPLLPTEKLRITPLGNVYTVERYVNGVATTLVTWTDTDGVYNGATNHRASPAWRSKLVGGHYYAPEGIVTWKAADVHPVTPSGSGGSDAWTYAVTKPSDLGLVIATRLWETSLR